MKHSRRTSRRSTARDVSIPSVPVITKPGTFLKPKSPRMRHRNLGIFESAPHPPRPREPASPPTARRHRPVHIYDFTSIRRDIADGKYIRRRCEFCGDPFGLRPLALMSCSHVCHSDCLAAPNHCSICHRLCQSHEVPAQIYEAHAALLIQRVFRGSVVRSQLGILAPSGSLMHRKWVLGRAQTASTMLADAIENQSDIVDAILASIDKELDWARTVMSAVEIHEKSINWAEIHGRIARRGCGSCSICLLDIAIGDCIVTSCEHCFHARCINGWMDFCHKGDTTASCPVCRSPFQYRALGVG
jgi:hypothetical protein